MARCPVCRIQIHPIDYEGVRVHQCEQCGGNWLTSPKLNLILARRDVDMPAAVSEQMTRIAAASNSTRPLLCLTCGKQMRKTPFRHWDEVQLDVCERCGGIWFDRAELERCQTLWEQLQSNPKTLAKVEKQAAAESRMVAERESLRNAVTEIQAARPMMGGATSRSWLLGAILRLVGSAR